MKATKTPLLFSLLLFSLASCVSQKQKRISEQVRTNLQNQVQKSDKPVSTQDKPTTSSETEAVDELDDYAKSTEVADPLEGLNRVTFRFNDTLYRFFFKPVSKGYEIIIPEPLRKGLDNAYDNARFPVRFVNNSLQGKFGQAAKEVGKFGLNTVGGIGGLVKQSDRIPALADLTDEDTGQTLGVWGLGHGFYLVLPLLGPSSLRDTIGLGGDYALTPHHWLFMVDGASGDWTWIPTTVNTVRSLPSQLKAYDEAKANAIDPYTAVRSSYVQNRQAAVNR